MPEAVRDARVGAPGEAKVLPRGVAAEERRDGLLAVGAADDRLGNGVDRPAGPAAHADMPGWAPETAGPLGQLIESADLVATSAREPVDAVDATAAAVAAVGAVPDAAGGRPRSGGRDQPRDQPGHGRGARARSQGPGGQQADQVGDEGRPPGGGGPERHGGCTAAQLRRFIKSRCYIPIHEIRRRFLLTVEDDDVAGFDAPSGRLYVGLPAREAQMLAELLRSGDVGCELQHDPVSPVVVGVFPMRPITRQ